MQRRRALKAMILIRDLDDLHPLKELDAAHFRVGASYCADRLPYSSLGCRTP